MGAKCQLEVFSAHPHGKAMSQPQLCTHAMESGVCVQSWNWQGVGLCMYGGESLSPYLHGAHNTCNEIACKQSLQASLQTIPIATTTAYLVHDQSKVPEYISTALSTEERTSEKQAIHPVVSCLQLLTRIALLSQCRAVPEM